MQNDDQIDINSSISNGTISIAGGTVATGTITVSSPPRWSFCPSCGKKLESDWNNCAGCGTAIGVLGAYYPVIYPYTYPGPVWSTPTYMATGGITGSIGPLITTTVTSTGIVTTPTADSTSSCSGSGSN